MSRRKVSFDVKFIDKGFEKLQRVLREAKARNTYVKAGVIGARAQETHNAPTRSGTITNAELAAVHEFGAPAAGVPDRSFIRSTFDANREKYVSNLKTALKKFYAGDVALEPMLKAIGLRMENDIKNRIAQGAGIPPPLAQSTIDKKGSSRPLVDTGQLVNSITSEVVSGGGE